MASIKPISYIDLALKNCYNETLFKNGLVTKKLLLWMAHQAFQTGVSSH